MNPFRYEQTNFWQVNRSQPLKTTVFQQVVLEKLDLCMHNNEIRPLPYTIYKKNQVQIKDLDLQADTINY